MRVWTRSWSPPASPRGRSFRAPTPGLTGLVSDIVSGGEGPSSTASTLPDEYAGLSVDEASARLRAEHRATLLAIGRGSLTVVNPGTDFHIEAGDEALVVAESLGTLAPLKFVKGTAASAGEAELTRSVAST